MQIKKPRDLTLRDLPNIESPFAAASKIDSLANRPGSPLTWDQSLVQDSPFARPLDQQTFVNRLREKLEKGELLMVYGVTDGRPFNPLVAWHDSGTLPARWQVEKSIFGLNLEHKVAQLNDWQITPEQIDHLGPGGIGHLSASSFDSDLRAQQAEERAQAKRDQEGRLSMPIGAAAAVAPLAAVALESDEETKPEKKLHIEVGIFTDGTGNNAGNVKTFEEKLNKLCVSPHQRGEISEEECSLRLALLLGDSYASAQTNVSKLSGLYPQDESETESLFVKRGSIYTPGVGTITGDEDSLISSGTGIGSVGVLHQVEMTFQEMSRLLRLYTEKQHADQLTVDVFGFSRGAAAARHIISEISKGQNGSLGKKLAGEGISWPQKVEIRFAGLFDTVAGILNPFQLDFSASNDQNSPVDIYLDSNEVNTAVHLVATNECRKNFALNSLADEDGSLPTNFREIQLPGAHSDVGGGYLDEADEEVLLARKRTIDDHRTKWPEQTMDWDNLSSLEEQTTAQDWIGEYSLRANNGSAPFIGIAKHFEPHPTPFGHVILELQMNRRIKGDLSKVALHLMHALALESQVPFLPLQELRRGADLPEDLIPIHSKLWNQIAEGSSCPALSDSEYSLVKQKYVHHSDNFNTVPFLAFNKISDFEIPWDILLPFKPTANRDRIIHPNIKEGA